VWFKDERLTVKAKQWRRFERSSDAYATVTILLLLLILLPIITDDFREAEGAVTAVLIGAAVTLAMAASQAPRWVIHASWVASLVALISVFVDRTNNEVAALGGLILAVFLISTPVVILRRIARHERVTATTIWGAVAAYLAFGVAFSMLYTTVFVISPDAFNNMTHGGLGETNYFSFVTLTTLGYGDITPINDVARAFVIFETLIGQIYLVIVVARIVALLGKPYTKLPKVDGD
jgi:hypothetical protein